MADWKYNPADYDPDSYKQIPPGEYRVRIEDCEEQFSRTGKEMFRLTLAVSGYSAKLWYYLVFDSTNEEARERTNQRLGSAYDSFGIPPGSMEVSEWKGKTGGAKVRYRTDDQGETRSEVHYFLPRKKVETLPAWQEGKKSKRPTPESQSMDFSPEAFNPDEGFVNQEPSLF